MDAAGVSVEQVQAALQRAASTPSKAMFDGIVFESDCAASAYANFSRSNAAYFMVVDMGAGTTDIAGFGRAATPGATALSEIMASRKCCTLAGDELDSIIVDLFVRSGGKQKLGDEDQLWRAVNLSARELKHELFARGKRDFKYAKKKLQVTRSALANDSGFRAYCRALREVFAGSLGPVLAAAKSGGVDTVFVLLAGGGSNLPFLAHLIRAAAVQCKSKLRVKVEPFGANWTLPHQHHPFAGVFPQLAIAMGGALAPRAAHAPPEPQLA
jgi:molecular chaperone DnaK (HSP70)